MALISLNNLERFLNNLKTYISNALSSKANSSHTHSASDISDFPTNYVTTDTSQTITATKKIAADLKFSTSYTRGTAPSWEIYRDIFDYRDSADNRICLFESIVYPDKKSRNCIYAYDTTVASGNNIGCLGIGCTSDGTVFTQAPTPDTSDNSTQIATTAWVKNQGYIPLSGTTALAGSIVPSTDNTYDLGSTSKNLKVIYSRKIISNGDGLDIYSCALDQGAYIALDKNDTQYNGAFRIYTGTSSYMLQGSRTGKLSWSGTSIEPATDNTCDLGSSSYGFKDIYTNKIYLKDSTIFKLVDDNYICIGGSTAQANGANIVLNGKDRSTNAGEFKLEARDGTNTKQLIGKPDGTLSWNGNIIPSTDNTYTVGNSSHRFSYLCCNQLLAAGIFNFNTSSYTALYGGTSWQNGARILVYAKDHSTASGVISIIANNGTNSKELKATPSGTLSWSGSAISYTSDYRLKDNIESIPDEILNAWEALEAKQFKYKSDLETDKENAQTHFGWIAQDVESIIKGNRKTEVQNGLFTHESWDEQEEVSHEEEYQEEVQTKSGETETVTKTRKVIDTPYRAEGDSYGLRYTECLVVECAYLRKKNKELQEQLNSVQTQLNKVIARLDKLENNNLK